MMLPHKNKSQIVQSTLYQNDWMSFLIIYMRIHF